MLTCKEITRLLSESQDRKLKMAEQMRLKMHLAVCEGCSRYKQQLNFIRRACRIVVGGGNGPGE